MRNNFVQVLKYKNEKDFYLTQALSFCLTFYEKRLNKTISSTISGNFFIEKSDYNSLDFQRLDESA
jgi:hypothetical protein